MARLVAAAKQAQNDQANDVITSDNPADTTAEVGLAAFAAYVADNVFQAIPHGQANPVARLRQTMPVTPRRANYNSETTADLYQQLPSKELTAVTDGLLATKIAKVNIQFDSTIPPSPERDQFEAQLREYLAKILPKELLVAILRQPGFLIRVASMDTMNRLSTGISTYLPEVRHKPLAGTRTTNGQGQAYIALNYDIVRKDGLDRTLANEMFHMAESWADKINKTDEEVHNSLYKQLSTQASLAALDDWENIQNLRQLMLQRRDHQKIRLSKPELERVRAFTRLAKEHEAPSVQFNTLPEDEFNRIKQRDQHGRDYLEYRPTSRYPFYVERRYIIAHTTPYLDENENDVIEYVFSYAPAVTEHKPPTPAERAIALLETTAYRMFNAYMNADTFNQYQAEEVASDAFSMTHSGLAPDGVAQYLFPNTIDYWNKRIGHPIFNTSNSSKNNKNNLRK